MSKSKRRDFIRKSLLGTAGIGLGAKLFARQDTLEIPPIDISAVSWEDIRQQFVLTEERVYLNSASLGPSPKSVIKTVQDWTMKLEKLSETGHSNIEGSRKFIAEHFNVFPEEIAFTRNTTEGVNIIARGLDLKKGDEIIMTNHEHVGGASPWMAIQKEIGIKIKIVEPNLNGENNLNVFKKAIRDNTKLIFFCHVTCTNGMRLPVKEIVAFCREKGILSCVDGAQAMGQIAIDLHDLKPDFYVSSGHKWLLGPKGTGILYINKDKFDLIKPTFVGAYTVENFELDKLKMDYVDKTAREEYGTRSTAVIKGLEESFRFLSQLTMTRVESRGLQLAAFLHKGLEDIKGVEVLSPKNDDYRSAIITFRLKDKDYLEVQKLIHAEHKCRVRGIYEADLKAIRASCGIHLGFEDLRQLIVAVQKIASA